MPEVLQLARVKDGEDGEGGGDGLVKVEAEVLGSPKLLFPTPRDSLRRGSRLLLHPRPPLPSSAFLLTSISSLVIIRNLRTAATWSKVVHDRG